MRWIDQSDMVSTTLLILIVIAALVEITLLILVLRDWLNQPASMPNRYIWLIIGIVINIIGPIIYFIAAPRVGQIDQDNQPMTEEWGTY